MKKKDYLKPTMNIVKLQQQTQLLAGSVLSTRPGYGDANSELPPGAVLEGETWLWD